MEKRWTARPAPLLELREAPDHHDLPPPVSLLLARRGYSGKELDAFLRPDIRDLTSWRDLGGAEAAASRIASAVRSSEKIVIHGDFDADGMTATTIAYLALERLGADADFFIPDRLDDGYGLGDSSVSACREAGAGLLVTVDCGISDVEHVRALGELGVDTVITDHHLPGEELPAAFAIVDPALDGCDAGFPMAGAGVAWMMMRGVFELMGADEEPLEDLLQLAAVGTVADVVDLVGDNRLIAAEGIRRMRQRPLPGLGALAESSSTDIREVTSSDLAFRLGPRLNACGRVGRAGDALDLLLAPTVEEASKPAALIEEHNRLRKKLDRELEDTVLGCIGAEGPGRCIVMAGGGWHRGVVGIVASRLASRFGVPSVIIAVEDGVGFGSARSVPGVPIHSIISTVQSRTGIMHSLGGHPMAAGFRLPSGSIGTLKEGIRSILAEDRWSAHLGPVQYIDGRLGEGDFNAGTVRALRLLEPFGEGNREPVWISRGACAVSWKKVGREGSHLSCVFRTDSGTFRAIGFNMASCAKLLSNRVDLAFRLSLDTWRGDGSVQLVLEDIRAHGRSAR